MDVLERFGKKVRATRLSRDLSQEDLAELSGPHRTYNSLVERGKRNIGLRNIDALARALGVSIHELLKF